MPGSYCHHRLGNNVIDKLDSPLKDIIINNIDLFNLGLHGPDILFYNRPYLRSNTNRIGSKMHKDNAYSFFINSIDIIKETKSEAMLIYMCGYICHYILDSNMHGYISKIMKETNITHFEIETELDRYFMIKDHKDPLRTRLTDHIIVSDYILDTIQPFYNVSRKNLKKSIKGIKFYDRLLLAPQLYKRALIYLVLKITFTFKRFQGFVVNYKPNKKLTSYITELEKLYDKSIDESCKYIIAYIDTLLYGSKLPQRFNHNFK